MTQHGDNRFTLIHGVLLALAGGYLDAFTFIEKGQVFANAMTGNVVLLGVVMAGQDWADVIRHLAPIIAFFLAIVTAEILKHHRPINHIVRPATACLLIESSAFIVAGFLPPRIPNYVFTIGISFLATLQNSMFTQIAEQELNTVMTTGNLRKCLESLIRWIFDRDSKILIPKIRVFGTVCSAFFAGALLSGLLSPRLHNKSLWAPSLVLILCMIHWRRHPVARAGHVSA
jgi:uncharacterized membrane protein YoaK (UPF0700 family)